MKVFRAHILTCGGTGCRASGSEGVHQAVVKELAAKGLTDEIAVVETGCNGFCAAGPIMVIYPEGTFYQYVKPADVKEIIEEHIIKGRPVKRLMY
ncbi:MAG TPA: (2Fe-2S) ferredoxin domain-containing protein, partial [Deltaproteobacteria bacterium]|nr:(2Fe-2S) ferredoxin domain-containing protein [Deltaproteobacteria bacterium]